MLRTSIANRLAQIGLLFFAGAAAVFFAARAAGATGAGLAAIALACAFGLILLTGRREEALPVSLAFDAIVLALPGALIVFFSLNSGGYFPDAPAVAVI